MGALVSSKATAETNHQRIGVDALQERHYTRGVALILEPILGKLLTNIGYQLFLQRHTRFPYFGIWHLIDVVPNLLVALIAHERRIKVLVIDATELGRCPCRQVHTVGNIAHMTLFRIIALPDRCEHFLAHPSMQLAHTVDFLRSVASKGTHTESFCVVVRIFSSHADELIP